MKSSPKPKGMTMSKHIVGAMRAAKFIHQGYVKFGANCYGHLKIDKGGRPLVGDIASVIENQSGYKELLASLKKLLLYAQDALGIMNDDCGINISIKEIKDAGKLLKDFADAYRAIAKAEGNDHENP